MATGLYNLFFLHAAPPPARPLSGPILAAELIRSTTDTNSACAASLAVIGITVAF